MDSAIPKLFGEGLGGSGGVFFATTGPLPCTEGASGFLTMGFLERLSLAGGLLTGVGLFSTTKGLARGLMPSGFFSEGTFKVFFWRGITFLASGLTGTAGSGLGLIFSGFLNTTFFEVPFLTRGFFSSTAGFVTGRDLEMGFLTWDAAFVLGATCLGRLETVLGLP